MTRYRTALALVLVMSLSSCDWIIGTERPSTIIDHEDTSVSGLSEKSITAAKEKLDIVYWHTSHGSQLVTGISGMDAFYGSKGWYTLNGTGGLLIAEQGTDIGNPGLSQFEQSVRTYLVSHAQTNVVMASWCGQVSDASEAMIIDYLARMHSLEVDYPAVRFVYMTGHADGTGLTGNLHIRNQQIRDYCEANDKWLYDFYDIECYDPDGAYYGDKRVSDACNYDYDGDGTTEHNDDEGEYGTTPNGDDRNWAIDWQATNPSGWWDCGSVHSRQLNANQKARAAWNLWVRLARDL